ncbi:aquaporin [Nocardia sp. NPDC059239]|uniref:aquaporin n=1 Tax=unclassified Nocardia TaxID=2637762 RepID=UPI00367E96E6
MTTLTRRLLAEFVGTGLLVAVVVGSGIAAQQLSPNDVGVQLLENSTATVFGLGILILMFGPVSGAHFNPVVSAADWLAGRRRGTGLTTTDLAAYSGAQVLGGIAGSVLVRPTGSPAPPASPTRPSPSAASSPTPSPASPLPRSPPTSPLKSSVPQSDSS